MVGTKNEFVVLSLRRATVPRGDKSRGGSALGVASHWWSSSESARSDEKCRLYRETGRGARSFEDSAWLISADQPRDKFMCRPPRYIYIRTRRTQERERRKKRAGYSGYLGVLFRRDSTHVRGRFLPLARLHADSIPNRKRQREDPLALIDIIAGNRKM